MLLIMTLGGSLFADGFRPKLPNGCAVEATEFAWVEDAAHRLPQQARPHILIVAWWDKGQYLCHAYCAFMTPRGSWFAYNPTHGSQQLLYSKKPDAQEWASEIMPTSTGVFERLPQDDK